MIPENTPRGTKVLHHKLGILTVVDIDGDRVECIFGEHGSTMLTYRKFLNLIEE